MIYIYIYTKKIENIFFVGGGGTAPKSNCDDAKSLFTRDF